MEAIVALIDKDLSEPYSILTYRYFIYNWSQVLSVLCCVCACACNAHGHSNVPHAYLRTYSHAHACGCFVASPCVYKAEPHACSPMRVGIEDQTHAYI